MPTASPLDYYREHGYTLDVHEAPQCDVCGDPVTEIRTVGHALVCSERCAGKLARALAQLA